jgi:hypothetical protein
MPEPIQSAWLRRAPRGPATSIPAASATSRNAIKGLLSSARPATIPAIGQIQTCPVRTTRATNQVSTAHASRSNVDVLSRCPTNRTNDPTAVQLAAISCARRLPPNSNASAPVTITVAPIMSADGMRKTVSEPGATPFMTCAISGDNGPWSANPHAR